MTSLSYDGPDDERPALGAVLDAGRGSLPYTLVHGEALVACAAWALGEAGVTTVDLDASWPEVRDSGLPLVLHDALCPMTPPDFVAACLRRALDADTVVVGVRPVTDTVKGVADGLVRETVDRDGLLAVASPVVLPPAVVGALSRRPGPDLAALVVALRADGVPLEVVEAPAAGRRVASRDDVRLLEALTQPRH